MNHTVLPAITYTSACLNPVSVHQMAPPQTEMADIMIAVYYLFIYPERMKG